MLRNVHIVSCIFVASIVMGLAGRDCFGAAVSASIKFSESRVHTVKKVKFIGPKEFPKVKEGWTVTGNFPGLNPASFTADTTFIFDLTEYPIIKGHSNIQLKLGEDPKFAPGLSTYTITYGKPPVPIPHLKVPLDVYTIKIKGTQVTVTFKGARGDEEFICGEFVNVSVKSGNLPAGSGTYTGNARLTLTFAEIQQTIDTVPFTAKYKNTAVGALWAASCTVTAAASKP